MKSIGNWKFVTTNYYGGRIYKHVDGRRAIEVFNHYYRSIGFSIKNLDGTWSNVKELS